MYKFVYYKNVVTAISSFAGKTVKGTAKCEPGDTFNKELGERLARVRCDVKVAKKRSKHAAKKYTEAKKSLEQAQRYVRKMEDYVVDANVLEVAAIEEYKAILKEIG